MKCKDVNFSHFLRKMMNDEEFKVSKEFLDGLSAFLNFFGKKIVILSSSLVCYAEKDRIDKSAIDTACKLIMGDLGNYHTHHRIKDIPDSRAKTLIKNNHNGSIAADAAPALAKALNFIASNFVESAKYECGIDDRIIISYRDLIKASEDQEPLRYLVREWKW